MGRVLGRRRAGLLALDLALAALPAFCCCVSTVRPPPAPVHAVTVYLRRDARHEALLLPRAGGGFVEYGFGDHDWGVPSCRSITTPSAIIPASRYALQEDRWYHLFDALLWPTRGTLGRRFVEARDLAGLRSTYPWSELTPIAVEEGAARRLEQRLAGEYEEHLDGELFNPDYELTFVVHDDEFWLFHNCHDALARWLRELSCSVSSVPVRLGLSVAAPRAIESVDPRR